MARRILVILILLLCFTSIINVQASIENEDKASDLKILGLFKGTDTGFELDRKPTRIEGAVMLVRLLGKEDQALNGIYNHPFADVPNWADPYIGYMFGKNLTNGISDIRYGSNQYIDVTQYTTFLLRALGYDDKNGDFKWNYSIEKAKDIGLINENKFREYKESNFIFLRDDLVNISYNSLLTKTKNTDKKLLDKLIESDVVDSNNIMETSVLYNYYNYTDNDINTNHFDKMFNQYISSPISDVKTTDGELKNISYYLYNLENYFTVPNIDIDKAPKENIDQAMDLIEKYTGLNRLILQGEYNGGYSVNYNISYIYTEKQLDEIKKKSIQVIDQIIKDDMSDYEKLLQIHDYIIKNCRYDTDVTQDPTNSSYNIYGCLIEKKAVCQGYAETMNLLSHLAGIDCIVVEGTAFSELSNEWIPHAWNIVQLDEEYYHIDVTWDDPVTQDHTNILTYNYFNITDNEMDNDHYWVKKNYPDCNGEKYNYFEYNNMVVSNYYEFKEKLNNLLDLRKKEITIKVKTFIKSNYNNLSELLFDNGVTSFSYSIDDNHGIIRLTQIKY